MTTTDVAAQAGKIHAYQAHRVDPAYTATIHDLICFLDPNVINRATFYLKTIGTWANDVDMSAYYAEAAVDPIALAVAFVDGYLSEQRDLQES